MMPAGAVSAGSAGMGRDYEKLCGQGRPPLVRSTHPEGFYCGLSEKGEMEDG